MPKNKSSLLKLKLAADKLRVVHPVFIWSKFRLRHHVEKDLVPGHSSSKRHRGLDNLRVSAGNMNDLSVGSRGCKSVPFWSRSHAHVCRNGKVYGSGSARRT